MMEFLDFPLAVTHILLSLDFLSFLFSFKIKKEIEKEDMTASAHGAHYPALNLPHVFVEVSQDLISAAVAGHLHQRLGRLMCEPGSDREGTYDTTSWSLPVSQRVISWITRSPATATTIRPTTEHQSKRRKGAQGLIVRPLPSS